MSASVTVALEHARKELPQTIDKLKTLARIPGVSANPAPSEELKRSASTEEPSLLSEVAWTGAGDVDASGSEPTGPTGSALSSDAWPRSPAPTACVGRSC